MPIFEYICQDCKKPFEALVLGSRQPECPSCHSKNLTQQISVFSVGGARSSAPSFTGCSAAAGGT